MLLIISQKIVVSNAYVVYIYECIIMQSTKSRIILPRLYYYGDEFLETAVKVHGKA